MSCTHPKAIVVKAVPLARTAVRRVLPPKPDATAVPLVEQASNRVSTRVNFARRALQDGTATGKRYRTAQKERIKTRPGKHRANFADLVDISRQRVDATAVPLVEQASNLASMRVNIARRALQDGTMMEK